MGKCFVTKLAGSVNNPSLLKLGEIKVISNLTSIGDSNDYIRVDGSADKPVTLKMESGYFRQSKDNDINAGTEMIVDTAKEVFPSTGEHIISVIPKYNLTYLQYVSLNIDGLSLSKNLKAIILNTTSSGDISALKGLTALTTLKLLNTNVSGDISALGTLVNLTYFDLSSSKKISGSISSLSNLAKLTNFKLKASEVSGDLATLPADCIFASLDKLAKFTWGSRPTNAKIVAIEGSPTISNIDKMLQDQAACQSAISSSDLAYYKTITATGTRTSASDAAVQTLQSKGYTVSITPA